MSTGAAVRGGGSDQREEQMTDLGAGHRTRKPEFRVPGTRRRHFGRIEQNTPR